MDDLAKSLQKSFFSSLNDVLPWVRLFDFLPHIYLYVKDTEGRFVGMNQAWVRMRGIKQEHELLGKTDLDLHPVYWGRQYQEEDRRVMESGGELPNQIWLVPGPDGELATFVSSKIAIRNRDKQVIGIAGVMYRRAGELAATSRKDPVQVATDLIAKQFGDPLEIQEVAVAVGLSVSQLNRRFRDTFQMSPSQYLQRVRVHEASRLLAESDDAISDVALHSGFYDQAHLTRTFRRWIGMTPLEFRKAASRKV